ncbi:MAG: hypothetical protein JW881_14185 [Spirochaetales bacterium]|nr:hypothetical protein [Spirochaetales bacterium]
MSKVNKALKAKKPEASIEKRIEKTKIIDKIYSCRKYIERALGLVPMLLDIISKTNSVMFPELVRACVVLLGGLSPDGLITGERFEAIASSMNRTADDVVRELEDRGYIENGMISPAFQPSRKDFSFTLDRSYDLHTSRIKELLLEASREMSVTHALMDLLQNDELLSIHDDIIQALGDCGNPIAFPLLLDKANSGNDVARDVLLAMCFRDIDDFVSLVEEGITEDLWGMEIREKLFLSIKQIMPFLFESLESGSVPIERKKKICFVFGEIGIKRATELDIFVRLLPVLMEADAASCPVTRILVEGGRQSVPYLIRFYKDGIENVDVLNRFVFILAEIGEDAQEAVQVLKDCRVRYPSLRTHVERALGKIRPFEVAGGPSAHTVETERGPDTGIADQVTEGQAPGIDVVNDEDGVNDEDVVNDEDGVNDEDVVSDQDDTEDETIRSGSDEEISADAMNEVPLHSIAYSAHYVDEEEEDSARETDEQKEHFHDMEEEKGKKAAIETDPNEYILY